MADNTVKVRLQSAYKSSADWDTLNPVLKNGEVGYVSSPASMYGWYKIGNGTSTWKQLPYSTYRPLNNGDFDTINVTDETAGNLIVTGAARFLNTIQGTATSAVNAGTASSADNSAKLGGTAASSFLLKSGGTMTGLLTAQGNKYSDSYTGALNMNNSNIYGVNSIYTADASDTAGEGIHFYRDSTHVDTLWMNGGDLLFVPNRLLAGDSGTTATKAESEKVARLPKTITTGQLVVTDTTGGLLKTTAASAITVGSASYATNASQLGGHTSAYYVGTGSTVSTMTTAGGTKLPNETAVKDYVGARITELGQPMHYEGTITTSSGLPATAKVGDTYLVAEKGTYSTTVADVGDLFIYSPSSTWNYIPSANDDCVKSVGSGNSWITTGGVASAVTIAHADAQTSSGSVGPTGNVTSANIYGKSITVPYLTYDAKGHIVSTANRTVSFPASPVDLHTYLTSANFTSSQDGSATTLKIVTSGSSAATATCTISTVTSTKVGLVPKLSNSATQYFNGTGGWTTPPNTTYSASASDKIALGGTNSTVFYHTTAFSASGAFTAGTAGTADAWGESIAFTVPEFNYDKWGHLTSTSSKAFKVAIPANPNVDTKATQTATTAKTYLIGNAGSATTTSGCNLSQQVYTTNGDVVLSGKLTVGGNNADTAGARLVYNSSLESLSVVFA